MRRSGCAAHVVSNHLSGFLRNLYRSARVANDIETVASGNPKRIARRATNKLMPGARPLGFLLPSLARSMSHSRFD
jgi:hypothetical protein